MQNQKIDFCQCCLQRHSYIHLKASNVQFGKPDTYEEMLKECYGITMRSIDKAEGICVICIKRLRDAYEFRLQITMCQNNLEKHLDSLVNNGEENKKVKVELSISEGDIPGIQWMRVDETEREGDARDIFKQEPNSAEIPFEFRDIVSAFVPHSAIKDENKSTSDITLRSSGSSRLNRKKELTMDRGVVCNKTKRTPARKSVRLINKTVTRRRSCGKKKVEANVNKLIRNTNCTPFNGKQLLGFACSYCKNTLKDLPDLKSHVTTDHKNKKLTIDRNNDNISVKVDITDLKCTICDAPYDNISSVTQHLIDQHKVTFHKDVPNCVLEFRLPSDGVFQCTSCNSKFETFKMLLQHMNVHYRNFVCDICDAGFVNAACLRMHKMIHSTKSFKCSHCDKTFPTVSKRTLHQKCHTGRKKWVCPYCNVECPGVNYYFTRNKHLLTEHNIVTATYECNICDRKFLRKAALTKHIKKFHLLERNSKCSQCDYACYSKKELSDHMLKHTGERKYQCELCHKAYSRKSTLREHMRIHNNDRRHVCHVCASAFVQKCSLKSHLLSHHSMSLEENEQLNLDSK